ncbi:hypothetical protein BC941DRAFT_475841 [Chlamydoabsidia padenii]|nr:hypothetical protein BC941DRAFT_475841 [Chlamydoabsidia padenii]
MFLLIILFLCSTIHALPHQCQLSIPVSSGHRFSQVQLAPFEIHEHHNEEEVVTEIHPIAAAAATACYDYCHQSELMTFSSQFWKHHKAPLTLLDRAAQVLLETDFFHVNETYFINHMAMTDQDGPGGLGCFVLETPSTFSLYTLDDPRCRFTRSVICGNSGGGGMGKESVLTDSSSSPPPGGKVNLAETITQATAKTDAYQFKSTFTSGMDDDDDDGDEASFMGFFSTSSSSSSSSSSFSSSSFPSFSSSSSPCDEMGSLDTTNLPIFTSWLKETHPVDTPIQIKAWNGDTYSAGESNSCLAFSLAQGIHLSPCTDTPMVLCKNGNVMPSENGDK